jgi:hypothetical protein
VPRWIRTPPNFALAITMVLAGLVVPLAGGDPEIGILLVVGGALEALLWPALRAWTPSKSPDDYR